MSPLVRKCVRSVLIAMGWMTWSNPSVYAQSRPNVVMIVADDMGYADTGITGCKDFETPNIDSIAKDGVFCTRAYVTASVCSPSRAGFLSGRYQQRFGHEHNGPPNGLGLRLDQKLMPEYFKAAGYSTGMVGKWHLGETEPYRPTRRGFDEFVGHLGGGSAYFPPGAGEKNDNVDGDLPLQWEGYLTTYFGARAVDFIDRHADKPFFLYLSFNAPHTPLQARAEDLAKVANIPDERRRTYAAMMLALDESVGKVLEEIRNKGLADKTMVVFFSDNGGPQPGDPSVNGSINRPYRSGKAQYFEGGIRVPMFITYPGVIKPGSRYDKMVSSLDLLPTFMSATGQKPFDGVELDGANLLPFLTGTNSAAPHESLYWRTGAAIALNTADYKLVWFRREGGLPDNPERVDLAKTQLFKISQDISETRELAQTEPERRSEMIDRWLQWDHQLVPPLWGTWQKKQGE